MPIPWRLTCEHEDVLVHLSQKRKFSLFRQSHLSKEESSRRVAQTAGAAGPKNGAKRKDQLFHFT